MAVLVQKIVDDVLKRLNDTAQTRWNANDIVGFISNAEKNIVVNKPDAYAKRIDHPLVAGINQTLPSDNNQLMDIARNVSGGRITPVDENLLNSQLVDWSSYTPSQTIQHYTYNPKFPNLFKVFPPAEIPAAVELYYSAVPPLVTLNGSINLDDIYENPIFLWAMYESYAINAEFADGAANAGAYLQAFRESLGLKGQVQAVYAKQE